MELYFGIDHSTGDVTEQADVRVSKTREITSRVGSIPTIPIKLGSGVRGWGLGSQTKTNP